MRTFALVFVVASAAIALAALAFTLLQRSPEDAPRISDEDGNERASVHSRPREATQSPPQALLASANSEAMSNTASSSSPTPESEIERLRSTARQLLGKYDYEGAMHVYVQMRALDPLDPEALRCSADIFQKTGRAPEATALLHEAAWRRPSEESSRAYVNALVYEAKYEAALEEAAHICDVYPASENAILDRVRILVIVGRIDEAQDVLARGLRAFPASESLRRLQESLTQARR